jgi:hypothetical protein
MILYCSQVQNGEYGFRHCIRYVQDGHHLGLHIVTEAENKSPLKSASCQALDLTVCILHTACENLIHHGLYCHIFGVGVTNNNGFWIL